VGCNQLFPSGCSNCAFSDAPLQACYGPVDKGLQVPCFQVFHCGYVALDQSYSRWRGVLLGRRLGWNGAPTMFRLCRFYGMVRPVWSVMACPSGPSLGICPACFGTPARSVSRHLSGLYCPACLVHHGMSVRSISRHLSGPFRHTDQVHLKASIRPVSARPPGLPQHIHPVRHGTGILIILQTYWLLSLQDSLSRLTGDSQYFELGGGVL